MNIKKVAAVCKREGRLKVMQVGGALFAGTDAVWYRMPDDLPRIRTADEMAAVLGYTLKERDKIMATMESYGSAEELLEAIGVDVRGMRQGDRLCERQEISVGAAGMMLAVMACEDGSGEFVDAGLLAPMAEDLREYGNFYRRSIRGKASCYVAMNGFETVGIVLPVNVPGSIADKLREIARMCERCGRKGEEADDAQEPAL